MLGKKDKKRRLAVSGTGPVGVQFLMGVTLHAVRFSKNTMMGGKEEERK